MRKVLILIPLLALADPYIDNIRRRSIGNVREFDRLPGQVQAAYIAGFLNGAQEGILYRLARPEDTNKLLECLRFRSTEELTEAVKKRLPKEEFQLEDGSERTPRGEFPLSLGSMWALTYSCICHDPPKLPSFVSVHPMTTLRYK